MAGKIVTPVTAPIKLPKVCKQLASVRDLGQLEPLLIESGKIKESMSQAEKESIIRQYIANKNSQYQACLASKGKKVSKT